MKEVFDYISNNSFLVSILSIFIGWLLSTCTHILDLGRIRKEEEMKERREAYKNKAELKLIKVLENKCKEKPNVELFLTPIKVNEDRKSFSYPEDFCNKKKHKYKDYYFKNVGGSDILYLDINTIKNESVTLIEYSSLNEESIKKFVENNHCHDIKIFKDDIVIIRIYYLENDMFCLPFSASMALMFEDSFHNFWRQPFWYEKNKIYEPYKISRKKYMSYILPDDY